MGRAGISKLDAIKDELIRYYQAGNSCKECGEAFGFNKATIKDFLRSNGVSIRSRKEAISLAYKKAMETRPKWFEKKLTSTLPLEAIHDELIQFYTNGNSLVDCGEHFGFTATAIRDHFVAKGIAIRSSTDGFILARKKRVAIDPDYYLRASRLDEHKDEVIRLYTSGESPKVIGEQFGITIPSVIAFLKKHGVAIRNRNESMKVAWKGPLNELRLVPDAGPYHDAEIAKKQISFDFLSTEPFRRCPRCGRDVPESGWRKKPGKRYPSYCKRCFADYTKNRHRGPIDEETKAKNATVRTERVQRVRLEVLAAYGGKCACCGEHHHEFLVIDHIHGGGNRHRAYLKTKGVANTVALYRWLQRNGYPSGFRVLCHRCNSSYASYGYCPHQEP